MANAEQQGGAHARSWLRTSHARPEEDVIAAFTAVIEDAHGGGHFVAVPDDVASAIGAGHMMRVRGTLGGAAYRSNVAKMGGRLILGVHKATLQAAGKATGDTVEVSIEPDNDPR